MPNPDPHPPVIRSEKGIDRPQPVMAGAAAAALYSQLAGPQIDLVMYDDDIGKQELEKPRRLADRLAGRVHKRLRLQQQDSLTANRRLREFALEAVAESRGTVPSGNRTDRHEADVVTVAGVAGTRIAETDN